MTLNLNVDSYVANAHIVTGLPQRKGVNPTFCQIYTEIKYVKNVSCVGHLSSVNLSHQCPTCCYRSSCRGKVMPVLGKWEALGSSPKVVTTLREGYTLPFRFRPNLTRSPAVISNYHNPAKQSFLLEALYQLIDKNAVEPVENQNSLGFYNRLFLVPKPNNRWRQHTKLSVSAIQPGPSQEPVKSEPTCLAPRASAIKEQGFSEAVAAQIEAPQRGSTRSVYEAKWTIFTKWCLSNQVDFRHHL